MLFADIDARSLKYGMVSSRDSSFSWMRNYPPQDKFISLRTNQTRQVEIFTLNIQIVNEPKPQIRLSAEVWSQSLLRALTNAGFASRIQPPNPIRSEKPSTQINVECYCDFGEDTQSLERARLFLMTLVFQSKQQCFSNLHEKLNALHGISKYIDDLASKNKQEKLCLGEDWVAPSIEKHWDQQAQIRENKALMRCGFFAVATAAVAAVAVMSTRLVL